MATAASEEFIRRAVDLAGPDTRRGRGADGDVHGPGADTRRALADTQKFANVRQHDHVSLVIDDLASTDPWTVRGVEIRGRATTEIDVDPPVPYMSRDLIRIRPERIITWGLAGHDGMRGRDVPTDRTPR